MGKKFSERLTLDGWNIWKFIKGRKKLIITLVGLLCVQLAFNPELTGLLAGGAVFEGLWSFMEYYFRRVEIK